MKKTIPVLFVRNDSVYKDLPGTDCYDISRDALSFSGADPVIAHPPCRLWCKLKGLAKCNDWESEKDLARFAIDVIRKNGGVLEHPEHSGLWKDKDMFNDGIGVTISIDQIWFGHKARKRTWLYIVGVPINKIVCPITFDLPLKGAINGMSKKQREETPLKLAEWLLDLTRMVLKPA